MADLTAMAEDLEVQAEAAKAQASDLQDQAKRLMDAARTLRFGDPKKLGPRKQRQRRRGRPRKAPEPEAVPSGSGVAVLHADTTGAKDAEKERLGEDGDAQLALRTQSGEQDG